VYSVTLSVIGPASTYVDHPPSVGTAGGGADGRWLFSLLSDFSTIGIDAVRAKKVATPLISGYGMS